jgi:hypothetical protein
MLSGVDGTKVTEGQPSSLVDTRSLSVSTARLLAKQCAVKKGLDFSGYNSRPGTGWPHPVAIEAAAEATKLSELSA